MMRFLTLALTALPYVFAGGVSVHFEHGVRTCTVTAHGGEHDDVPNILKAFEECGTNGRVVFPTQQTYWIGQKLNPVLHNVDIEWRGTWLFSDDLNYWRNSSYPIAFQNHHAGFIITGDNIRIDGHDTGGINGNGDRWYTVEAGNTQPGRPMPFVFWNVSDVSVSNFFVKQPQLWSLNIMNGTNMNFHNIICNATATKAPFGDNWVQNTDGFDTMDVNNVVLENFVYQGGDDCIAIKPRSYNVKARNVTCHGGNGIAVGSLGQYLEDSSVENIWVDHVTLFKINNDLENGAYIKTWVGELVPQSSYESDGKPRGGGWGVVRDVLFSNFNMQGPGYGAAITQDSGDNGSFPGTSNMEISNVAFVNFTGFSDPTSSHPDRVAEVSCSYRHPCFNVEFQNFTISPGQNSTAVEGTIFCEYTEPGAVHGAACTNSSSLSKRNVETGKTGCWTGSPCTGPESEAFEGPWSKNMYSPRSRVVNPNSIISWPHLHETPYPASYALSHNGSLVTYDFGKEVGGLVTLAYTGSGNGQLGIAFSEAKSFIGEWSDSSNGQFGEGRDGALYTTVDSGRTTYQMPKKRLRGGFRYMTVFLETNSTATAILEHVSVELAFQPTWPNLRAYQGYFHSSDELLNRIWYAGAYTLQSNMVPTDTGRQVPFLINGWANNATLGPGSTVIVDGAKRDRAVWPGDMGVAVPSTFVSLGDLESVKNALQVMYNTQNKTTGAFAESGPPLSQTGSDTYHMWTMIGSYNYYLYTKDTDFLQTNWAGYQNAMSYILHKVDESGLLNVTGIRDWARWQQGFHNTEANVILYHTLTTGTKLAKWIGDDRAASSWSAEASHLGYAINRDCFNRSYGAYKDNDTSTSLHPQDANSLALLFDVAPSDKVASIAKALIQNWTPIGPETPELPNNVSPFISSFELLGRLTHRNTKDALGLLRTTWGWIINNKNSTESTLLEGYLTNGSFSYRNNRGYGYDATYPSHSHGWSTGPTSALTNHILGLDITQPAGSEWTLSPQVGDLAFAAGGFTTPLGKFQASWEFITEKDIRYLLVHWNVPKDTTGTITLPGARDIELDSSSGYAETVGIRKSKSAYGGMLATFCVTNNGTAKVRYEGEI